MQLHKQLFIHVLIYKHFYEVKEPITWTNYDPDLCRHMAPLGHNRLNIVNHAW